MLREGWIRVEAPLPLRLRTDVLPFPAHDHFASFPARRFLTGTYRYSVSRLIPNSRASVAFESPSATRRRNSAARGCERRFPAAVLPFLLCDRNPLALALTDQLSLELSKRPHDTQQQIRHGRILAGEGQVFLHKDDMDARPVRPSTILRKSSRLRASWSIE
jgi:hypothetical protein